MQSIYNYTVHPKQTMNLRYIVLHLFCGYNLYYM